MQRLTCGTRQHAQHWQETYDLCEQHGVDPHETGWIEPDVVDTPLLRFGLYLADDNGRRFLNCDPRNHERCSNQCIAMTTVERALIGELPPWWPNI